MKWLIVFDQAILWIREDIDAMAGLRDREVAYNARQAGNFFFFGGRRFRYWSLVTSSQADVEIIFHDRGLDKVDFIKPDWTERNWSAARRMLHRRSNLDWYYWLQKTWKNTHLSSSEYSEFGRKGRSMSW